MNIDSFERHISEELTAFCDAVRRRGLKNVNAADLFESFDAWIAAEDTVSLLAEKPPDD